MAELRWWDGRAWTGWTAPGPTVPVVDPRRPVAEPASPVPASRRRRLTVETVIVLAVFPLPYVVNALAVLVQAAYHQSAPGRIPLPVAGHLPASFLLDVVLTLEPLAAAALAIYLLTISGEGGPRAIGLDRRYVRTDLALVLPVFLLCFLLPQIGVTALLSIAHVKSIVPAAQHLPGYFAVVGIASAMVAGIVEEIVVLGFLVRRLEQAGLRPATVVVLAVAVRISYHLYYGWGVLPILAWALASVVVYRRYRRLGPFLVVHGLWDLGLILVPFSGAVPIVVETVVLLPSTFIFLLLWRKLLPYRAPSPGNSVGPWRAG